MSGENLVEILRESADQLEREQEIAQRAVQLLQRIQGHYPMGINPHLDSAVIEARQLLRELEDL